MVSIGFYGNDDGREMWRDRLTPLLFNFDIVDVSEQLGCTVLVTMTLIHHLRRLLDHYHSRVISCRQWIWIRSTHSHHLQHLF